MIRLARVIVGLAGLVVVVAFAIANRTPVDVSFAPFPILVELPVYGVFLFGLALGGLIGGGVVWLSSLRHRRNARRIRNKVWALENQMAILRKQEQSAQAEGYTARRAVATQGAPS